MNIQIGHDAALIESKKKLISGTYLRNAWYVAAWSDAARRKRRAWPHHPEGAGGALPQGQWRGRALEDRCAHRFAPLSMGQVVGGDRIQCPYHGLEYDKSGACVLQSARQQEHPAAGAGEELSGDGEAQGDLDLDGRQAGRSPPRFRTSA